MFPNDLTAIYFIILFRFISNSIYTVYKIISIFGVTFVDAILFVADTPQWAALSLPLQKDAQTLLVVAERCGLGSTSLSGLLSGKWCSILMVIFKCNIGGKNGSNKVVSANPNHRVLVLFCSFCHCFLQGSACDWIYVWSFGFQKHRGAAEAFNGLSARKIYKRNQRYVKPETYLFLFWHSGVLLLFIHL